MIGIIAGILGLTRKEPKKLFAIIGIIFIVAFNIYQHAQMHINLEIARDIMIKTMNEVELRGGQSIDIPSGSVYNESIPTDIRDFGILPPLEFRIKDAIYQA